MIFFKKHLLKKLIIMTLILSACKLQEPRQSHGIVFLENRSKKLEINKSNKNDTIRLIGYPQIKDDNDENNWIYLERRLTKGKYHELGRHKLSENNVLILNFDKYGILNFKEILNKEQINKIKFSENTTENDLTKESFVQSVLQSVKQKMYSNRRGTKF
tara:strand:- start:30 stop:506 length:477 start_codon:yes stop_codon:yes gene_type:complete